MLSIQVDNNIQNSRYYHYWINHYTTPTKKTLLVMIYMNDKNTKWKKHNKEKFIDLHMKVMDSIANQSDDLSYENDGKIIQIFE